MSSLILKRILTGNTASIVVRKIKQIQILNSLIIQSINRIYYELLIVSLSEPQCVSSVVQI
jgi:hypothetical protein